MLAFVPRDMSRLALKEWGRPCSFSSTWAIVIIDARAPKSARPVSPWKIAPGNGDRLEWEGKKIWLGNAATPASEAVHLVCDSKCEALTCTLIRLYGGSSTTACSVLPDRRAGFDDGSTCVTSQQRCRDVWQHERLIPERAISAVCPLTPQRGAIEHTNHDIVLLPECAPQEESYKRTPRRLNVHFSLRAAIPVTCTTRDSV